MGVPLLLYQKHIGCWQKFVDNLGRKLQNWKFRALNFARIIVLTKEVLQPIPLYHMTIMPLPKTIGSKFRTIWRDFFWKGAAKKKDGCLSAGINLFYLSPKGD